MFTAIKGNNGRTIYVGMVGEKDDTSLRLEGTEWDANIQMQVPRMIECTLTAETAEKTKNVRVGHYLMVMLMPSKDNPDVGIAEEVGAIGDILSITNIKNNPKKIVLGVIRSAKRSESGSSMIIGMTGLKEYGKEIGHASSYIGSDGETRESYWTSFVGCNSTKYQNMVADRLEPQCQQPQQPRQSAAPQQPQQPQYQSAQQPQQPAVVQQPQYQQPQQPQYQQQSGVDNGGYYELPDDMLDDLPFA